MRILILAVFVFPALLRAQSAFLKNSDIVWAAEIEQDWIVDIPPSEDEWEMGITTIKLQRTEKNEAFWTSPHLANLVFHAALEGHFPVFKDPKCLIPADIFQVYPSRDTTVVNDKQRQVIFVGPTPDFKAWRLRQVLAYHKKGANWSTTVEAIAPLVEVKNEQGDSIGLRPLFWFRPDDKRQKLQSKRIVWAKKTENKQKATHVAIDECQLLKVKDGYQNPMDHFMNALRNDLKTPFYNDANKKLLDRLDRMSILASSDTIITYDPVSYEPKVMAVHNDWSVEEFRQLRLRQSWYWDERHHRLSICLDAVGVLNDVYDRYGSPPFPTPVFYRRQ